MDFDPYEVLGVASDAGLDEIKASYRKLALQWHPDRNIGTPEEEHEVLEAFNKVQQSYDLLGDVRKRAIHDTSIFRKSARIAKVRDMKEIILQKEKGSPGSERDMFASKFDSNTARAKGSKLHVGVQGKSSSSGSSQTAHDKSASVKDHDTGPIDGVVRYSKIRKSDVPPGVRGTKIDRSLIDREVLEEANEGFEEKLDCFTLLRILSTQEYQYLTNRTAALRDKIKQTWLEDGRLKPLPVEIDPDELQRPTESLGSPVQRLALTAFNRASSAEPLTIPLEPLKNDDRRRWSSDRGSRISPRVSSQSSGRKIPLQIPRQQIKPKRTSKPRLGHRNEPPTSRSDPACMHLQSVAKEPYHGIGDLPSLKLDILESWHKGSCVRIHDLMRYAGQGVESSARIANLAWRLETMRLGLNTHGVGSRKPVDPPFSNYAPTPHNDQESSAPAQVQQGLPCRPAVEHEQLDLPTPDEFEQLTAKWVLAIMEYLRPAKPSSEYTRVQWRCSCGQLMYGDYLAVDPKPLQTMCARLGMQANRTTEMYGPFSWSLILGRYRRLKILRITLQIYNTVSWILNTSPRMFLLLEIANRAEKATYMKIGLEVLAAICHIAYSSSPVLDDRVVGAQIPSKSSGNANLAKQHTENPALDGSPESTKEPSTGTYVPVSSNADRFAVPMYLELCVNRSQNLVYLGEIQLRDSQGNTLVKNDVELFEKIHRRYKETCRKGVSWYLQRPLDIHFVRFATRFGGRQTGIYDTPMAVPPEKEVLDKNYHYKECPLDPLPPIDRRTFYHFFWHYSTHPITGDASWDSYFLNRLPKKLNSSLLNESNPNKAYGWGVHIIEGPNKPVLSWIAAIMIATSFIVAVIYDFLRNEQDSGFNIGGWILSVLVAALTATYFHVVDAQ